MHTIPGSTNLSNRITRSHRLIFLLMTLAAGLLLAGCGAAGDNSASSASGTLVPTPTRDPSGYQSVPSRSCVIADWAAMQSNHPQGDLLAFRPGSLDLAYLAPTDRSSWYVGTLMLAQGPDYKKSIPLASGVLAAGDLTWSPAGTRLAFLAYRPNEGLYTVMTVAPDGSGLTDLFPTDTARTDGRASQKAIIGWKNEKTVEVMSSCGEECRQAYDLSADSSAEPTLVPSPVANYQDLLGNLQLHPSILPFEADQFPKNMPTPSPTTHGPSPNWSPDERRVAYLDKRGFLWMLLTDEQVMFAIDIGLRDVYETQWSANSQILGVRAEDRIFVLDTPCP